MQKYKILLELTNFNPKRSADFEDSNIIRIFAEKFELWQERPNKSLVPPTNNNRESANQRCIFPIFSHFIADNFTFRRTMGTGQRLAVEEEGRRHT